MQPDIKKLLNDFLPGATGDGHEHVLGIVVTEHHLHGLLIERDAEGTRVMRRFTRQRGAEYDGFGAAGGAGGSIGSSVPELESEETAGEDFNIQFGEGSDGSENLFLGSEFGDVEDGGGAFSAESLGGGGPARASGFPLGLSDLLEECRSAGYPDPALAFCLAATDVTQVELHLPDVNAPADATLRAEDVGSKKLRKALEAQYDGPLEKDRFAFLPMTPAADGAARFLALVGRPADPVVSTLRTLQEQNARLPGRGLLETEVSLYFGLGRAALRDADAREDDALIVRVGEEDTLVLFTSGAALRQSETLRSLNTQDEPETVCSRVLLLQDEYGIEDMQRVFVAGDAQEDALVESFEMFFPEAHVEPLRRHLPAETTSREEHAAASVAAAAAALRLSGHAGYALDFEKVDLLPPKLLKQRFTLPFSNAVPALLVLLAIVGIFFGVRYRHLQNEQEAVRRRLATYPENLADKTPKALQADIDSVQAASGRYIKSLEALDQLLQGSDQWSSALAEISRETAAVNGIWVDQWTPRTKAVSLSGNATSRNRIVQLAERTEGQIKSVAFSKIRDWPVYSFVMDVPLKTGLPEATKYLREQALAEEASSDSSGSDSSGGGTRGSGTRGGGTRGSGTRGQSAGGQAASAAP